MQRRDIQVFSRPHSDAVAKKKDRLEDLLRNRARREVPKPPADSFVRRTCAACCAAVKLVVEDIAPSFVVPGITAAVGGTFAAETGDHDQEPIEPVGRGILGSLIGLAVGAVAQAATPAAQRWVCGDCGCSHVTPT